MIRAYKKLIAIGLFILGINTSAKALSLAAGGKIGTLGLGADVTLKLMPRLNLRATGNWMDWSFDTTVDAVDFTLGADFATYGAALDFHPFANGFRVSGGLLFGNNSSKLDAHLSIVQKIGDHYYSASQIGNIHGEIGFSKNPAPFFGIGYGNAVAEDQSFTFLFELGVVMQSYDVTLTADGDIASSEPFQSDLNELENDVQSDMDDIKFYPIISFGMAYQF
ncbi:MAG: hypothetical protein EOL87_14840 [Spartobacteria bacterium]|nr:hypothetical protein [Spartobacteria bacterium]